jgi:hypothetical protein
MVHRGGQGALNTQVRVPHPSRARTVGTEGGGAGRRNSLGAIPGSHMVLCTFRNEELR